MEPYKLARPHDWTGRTVLVVGGGASARHIDFTLFPADVVVLAVNDSLFSLPYAHAVFTADMRWWEQRKDRLRSFPGCVILSCPPNYSVNPDRGGIVRTHRYERAELSDTPEINFSNGNSGFGAVTYAEACGAKTILLAGFDMRMNGHWHPEYEWGGQADNKKLKAWVDGFRAVALQLKRRKVSVINLSPNSAITVFPRLTVEEYLTGGQATKFTTAIRYADKQTRGAVVVAHPDDEAMWFSGLIMAHRLQWTIFCCSVPTSDPVRGYKFFDSCALLGATPRLLPFQEVRNKPLAGLENLNLAEFDFVVTHNERGEYGHPHHRQVHEHVRSTYGGPVICTSYGMEPGPDKVTLSLRERERKIATIECYNHVLPYEGVAMPKSRALINRYQNREGYNLFEETYHGL